MSILEKLLMTIIAEILIIILVIFKASVYDDEKRLLKANAITKFLVEHEENQQLIDYLKEGICFLREKIFEKSSTENSFTLTIFKNKLSTYKEILSKIEKK